MVSSGAAFGRPLFGAEGGVAAWPALLPSAGQSPAEPRSSREEALRVGRSARRMGRRAARSGPAGERRALVVQWALEGAAAAAAVLGIRASPVGPYGDWRGLGFLQDPVPR